MVRRGLLVSAVTALAVGGGLAVAHATTADCLAAYGHHCGTFSGTDTSNAHTVYWDVKGQVRAPNALVIGYSADSAADPATDFTLVQHIGHVPGVGLSDQNTVSYSFVYTPRGSWSNLCVADPDNGVQGVVLRTCNGRQWQRFFADRDPALAQQLNPGGGTHFNGDSIFSGSSTRVYAFQNAASFQFVSDDAPGASGRELVTDTVATGTAFAPNQKWTWIP
jgi:hypothetical protein